MLSGKNSTRVVPLFLSIMLVFTISISCITISIPNKQGTAIQPVSFSQKVSPSKESQMFSAQGVVDVTIPGSILKKEATLSINSIKNSTSPDFTSPYKALNTYEISLGDLHQFSSSVIIKTKYDLGQLTGSQNPENSLTAAYYDESTQTWMILPSLVDAENKQLIVLANHLSKIQIGQWASTDKSSGLPGLRGTVQPIFRSVSIDLLYDGEPASINSYEKEEKGNWGYPAGYLLTAEARTLNIPRDAYYVWRLNGKVVQEGLNTFILQTELKQPDTLYKIHVQVSLDRQLPVLAETYREIKIRQTDTPTCWVELTGDKSCSLVGLDYYIGHEPGDIHGFTGKPYCFKAVLHNCPQNTPISWSFGDGPPVDGRTVTHTWTTPGTKEIVLFRDSIEANKIYVEIIDPPSLVVKCEPSTTINVGDTCDFIASIAGVNDSNRFLLQDINFNFMISENMWYNRHWTGKPYATNRVATMAHQFKEAGTYNIKVTAASLTDDWISIEAQMQVTVVKNDKPQANETPPPLVNKQPPPSQNQGSGWYLDGAPVITKNKLPAGDCNYFGHSFTISSGSATGSQSWKDCSGQSQCGGTYTGLVTWTPPPAFMKPGTKIPFTGTVKTTAQNSCGYRNFGSGLTVKPNGGILIDVIESRSPSLTADYTVPIGSPGSKMFIDVLAQTASITGGKVTYNYVYK